jgi:hypothetical protein
MDLEYRDEQWADEVMATREVVTNFGSIIPCPDCATVGFYGPRAVEDAAGVTVRKYRACKFCGFWQEVGGEPYRCSMFFHECGGRGLYDWKTSDDYRCGFCGELVANRVEWPARDTTHPFHEIKDQIARELAARSHTDPRAGLDS